MAKRGRKPGVPGPALTEAHKRHISEAMSRHHQKRRAREARLAALELTAPITATEAMSKRAQIERAERLGIVVPEGEPSDGVLTPAEKRALLKRVTDKYDKIDLLRFADELREAASQFDGEYVPPLPARPRLKATA